MLKTDENDFFEAVLLQSLGEPPTIRRIQFLSGGYGNNVVRLETSQGNFCIKWNETLPEEAFATQANDCLTLLHTEAVALPAPLSTGAIAHRVYILFQDIGFHLAAPNFWEQLGEQLATLHAQASPTFGWKYANWLHGFELNNKPTSNWATFFFEQRLKPTFGKAFYDGKVANSYLKKLDELQKRTLGWFANEPPNLLHGNLYGDNILAGEEGKPVLLSPVPYYGNRELEITRLLFLGDIPAAFLETYNHYFPLRDDFSQRQPLYRLYILAQYVNRFGTGYQSGIDKILEDLLA